MSENSYFETRLNDIKKRVEQCDSSIPFALVDITTLIGGQWKKEEIHKEEYFRHLNKIRNVSDSYKNHCKCVTK